MGISLSGLGSGFDWKSVIDQLREVENTRLNSLNTQKTNYNKKLTAWETLSTRLSAFQTASQGLKDLDDFRVFKAALTSPSSSVSAESLLSVTADTSADKGRYSVVVSTMARAEKLQSATVYDDTTTALNKSGTLTINSKELVLDGTESLSTLRSKINEMDAGAVASILRDADGKYHLTLTSETEGAAGIALSDLGGADALFSTTPLQDGVDAEFTVDGLPMKSASNTVTEAVPGLTFTIKGESPTTTLALEVDHDNDAIKEKIQSFVDSYNNLVSFIGQQMSYDSATKETGGPLFGDTTLKNIKSSLQSILAGSKLGNLGVSIDKNNKLSLDSTKLASVLSSDFSSTITAFSNAATSIDTAIGKFTDYVNGGVTLQKNSIQSNIKTLDKRIESTQDMIDRKMELLTTQYIALDSAMLEMQNMSSYISSQLSSLTSK
ncbi:MAG: flagellar filament capping protein FliD [Syntrophobacteraceae bacterium]